jgi:flagellar hook protein FlgE
MPDTLTSNSSTAAGVTTINYNFGSSGGALGTVDPGTNLTITGPTAAATGTITAPVVAAGETVGTYATALQNAVNAAGIVGVTVTATAAGQLSISGANVSASGAVIQDPIASANATGAMTFDANGNRVSPASNVAGISFAALSDGAASLNMTWDLYGSNGKSTISQIDQTSAVASTTQDGYASGDYSGFSIGSDGMVTATFSNGQKLNVAQLALGNVVNLQGLKALGDGDYATTLASGTATIGTSGTAGLGTMVGGALEASNVNISAEFSNLIIAQRAFEANSKAVTTFDTVTQETINMIH